MWVESGNRNESEVEESQEICTTNLGIHSFDDAVTERMLPYQPATRVLAEIIFLERLPSKWDDKNKINKILTFKSWVGTRKELLSQP